MSGSATEAHDRVLLPQDGLTDVLALSGADQNVTLVSLIAAGSPGRFWTFVADVAVRIVFTDDDGLTVDAAIHPLIPANTPISGVPLLSRIALKSAAAGSLSSWVSS